MVIQHVKKIIISKNVKARCIDDKNKPSIIPDNLWVKEGENYTIIHVWKQVRETSDGEIVPTGIIGVSLAELDISSYVPYSMYNINRFSFTQDELDKLLEMAKDCGELNDVDISELMEILEVEEEYI